MTSGKMSRLGELKIYQSLILAVLLPANYKTGPVIQKKEQFKASFFIYYLLIKNLNNLNYGTIILGKTHN